MWSALFPGQGSQHPGMGRFLFDNFRSTQTLFEEASDTLNINFKKLCFDGPEEELQKTFNTQPALVLTSVATFNATKEVVGDLKYKFAAGHSVGEYSAAVAADSLKFTDALRAVRLRGEAMQEAVPLGKGGMIAVMGLEAVQVQQLCKWAEATSELSPLEPANYNSPGQIVCSGSAKLIEWLQENLDKGIFNPPPKKMRLIPLKVSAPFHCSLMKPAEEKMSLLLKDTPFADAGFPIVQNYTATIVNLGDEIRNNLVKQVTAPVRWIESVELMVKKDPEIKAIEFGPGKVLKGLVGKIAGEKMPVYSLNSMEDLKELERATK